MVQTFPFFDCFGGMFHTILLLADFGMLLTIWLVQVIIYPSFYHYSEPKLQQWHARYTQRITFFVLPLMFVQMGGHAWLLWQDFALFRLFTMLLIGIAWGMTFLVEVPYHSKIGKGENLDKNIEGLILWNWPRTIAWTLAFVIYFLAA